MDRGSRKIGKEMTHPRRLGNSHGAQLGRLDEDKQLGSGNGFCINMHSSHSLEELGYVARRYNSRPSVIYLHEGLVKGSSELQKESPNTLFENSSSIDTGKTVSERSDIEDYVNEREKFISQGLSCNNEDQYRSKKRHRTSFSSFQLKRLEEEFDGDNYIIGMKRWRLSEELEIPEKQIKIWFQNRRTKSKKHC